MLSLANYRREAALRRTLDRRNGQQGAALVVFVAVLVLGVAWFAVGALGKAAPARAEREAKTGLALQAAKQALLAYVASRAADAGEASPGRLPCPERLDAPGTANAGIAPPSPSYRPCGSVGRLPWKTLGVDQIRDGYGEPLWYAVAIGTWALVEPATSLTINPATANQLPYEGAANAVVAVIIAPGVALNTMSQPGTPPSPCVKVNQLADRYTVPYVVGSFLECGNSSGANYALGAAPWSNDRTISITAREVMDAIAGAVADRLQRQVAPALNEWRATASTANWGSSFLPYASTFTAPASNDLCGDFDVLEGLMPVASSPACDTRWTNGTVTQLAGLLNSPNCSAAAGDRYECTFLNASIVQLLKVRIRADAPRIATSFRNAITVGDITNTAGGTVSALLHSVSSSTGTGSVQFEVSFPLLGFAQPVTVSFPNPQRAAILSDSRMSWFVDNNWAAYTYYMIAPGTKLGAAAPRCSNPGDADCLVLNGLPAANGNSDDKRIVITLMGRAVGTQSQPSSTLANYLESHTAGSLIFNAQTVSSAFNDRHAGCPFQHTPASGLPVSIC
jgi:hypothetical protein